MEEVERDPPDRFSQVQGETERSSEHGNSNVEGLKRPLLRGLLADSPVDFSNSGNIISVPLTVEGFVAPTMINRGIRVSLRFRIFNQDFLGAGRPLPEQTYRSGGLACAALQCRIEDDYDNHLGLLLRPLDIHSFGRQTEPILVSTVLRSETLHIKSEKFLVPSSLDGNIVIRTLPSVDSGYILSGVHCLPPAHYNGQNRVLNLSGVISGALAAFIFSKDEKPSFAIVLGRVSGKDDTIADCILLQEENIDEEKDCMTESELLDFVARGYEPGKFGVNPCRLGLSTLAVSNTRRKLGWRRADDAEFFRIEIK
jgi:hypothetical protein